MQRGRLSSTSAQGAFTLKDTVTTERHDQSRLLNLVLYYKKHLYSNVYIVLSVRQVGGSVQSIKKKIDFS